MRKNEMFCPECGTDLKPWESECRNCGRKRRGIASAARFRIATSVLAVLLLAVSVLSWYDHTDYKKQVSSLKNEVQHLTDKNGDLQKSLDYQYDRVSDLTDELVSLRDMEDADKMQLCMNEYQFFCDHVCIWQDDGTNYCHMYGCELVDKSKWNYIIVNQEGAITRIDSGAWNACTACVPNLVRGSFQYAYWRNQQAKGSAYPNT